MVANWRVKITKIGQTDLAAAALSLFAQLFLLLWNNQQIAV